MSAVEPIRCKIYGGGLLATTLRKIGPSVGAYFAAGVSNSLDATESDYSREINEIIKFIKKNQLNRIIYFSSFTAIRGDSRYAEHKRNVEKIITENSLKFLIIRLPQVAGLTNNNTILSYFVRQILKKQILTINKSAVRRFIDVDDVARIANYISINYKSNLIVNIGPKLGLSAEKIAYEVSRVLGVKPMLNLVDGGDSQCADIQSAVEILGERDIIFQDDYQRFVIEKYVNKLAIMSA